MDKNDDLIKKLNNGIEESEDTTKYGEFVSSYFAWLSLEKQKEKAKKIEEITDNRKNK